MFSSSYLSSSVTEYTGNLCAFLFTRSVGEMPKTDDVKVDSEKKGLVTSSDVDPCQSEKDVLRAGENHADKDLAETLSDVLKDERNTNSSDLDLQGYDGEKNMEEALEHQAQLIGRYEAMERAQREWEEKFRENNSSPPVCFIISYILVYHLIVSTCSSYIVHNVVHFVIW